MVDRFAVGLLISLSVIVLLIGKADLKVAGVATERLADAVAPVLALLNRPVVTVRSAFDRIGLLLAVHDGNQRLREENRRLLSWQTEAARLAVQNRALQRLHHVAAVDRPPVWLTAHVVGDSGGAFVQALLLDAGSEQGLAMGMAATTPEGLVGRVIDVGRWSARLLLITDFNSRIPVVVDGSGDHAILEGDNSLQPRLRFLPLNPAFSVGDRVLTSGRGGVLPPGLMVGRIASVDGSLVRVQSQVDWTRLDYVALRQGDETPPPEAADRPAAAATGPAS